MFDEHSIKGRHTGRSPLSFASSEQISNRVLVHVDASFVEEGEDNSVAVIARNHLGLPLAIATEHVMASSALEAEILAIGMAIELAKKNQWQDVLVFSDLCGCG